MKYYVAADPHGFYTELRAALTEQGFFEDSGPHKLILCGDLFDRGQEAVQMQEFLLDLMDRDQVILIRGNHEDLTMKLLNQWHLGSYTQRHHLSNGTVDTVCQLTGVPLRTILEDPHIVYRMFRVAPLVRKIIPAMVDYFETEHYIFVHGWLPNRTDWRNASAEEWNEARWTNGMEAAHLGAIDPEKTTVCGHWHCSFGHAAYEGRGGEFDHDPDFSPFCGKGIIALDACTAFSRKVNCIVLED